MRRSFLLIIALSSLLLGLPDPAHAAWTNEEQQLIAVLQSDAAPANKDAACARLKLIGTDKSVPALATLLADEQLSHSARYALESMASAKAGRALMDALDKTTGLTQVGIINSLGFRGEKRAVPALAKLLAHEDTAVAAAASTALGQVGSSAAMEALQRARTYSAGAVHDAMVDACLRCANRLLAAGSESKATAIFQTLYQTEKAERVHTAALRGIVLCSGNKALHLMVGAILSNEPANQAAALQLVREVMAPDATKTFAVLLHKVQPTVQVALIENLSQRGDGAAAPAIAAMVNSKSPEVRLAAINALGILGNASLVPVLAVAAAKATGEEQKAARLALVQLRRGNPTQTLLRLLPDAKPDVQAEFARALGDRADTNAVPGLVALARQGSESASKAARQALALLVDDAQVGLMVGFVAEAKSEVVRADAAEALNSACQQILARRGKVNVEPLVQTLATAPSQTRIALLPVCSGLIDPKVRTALRATVSDSDSQVRAAAIRALCDTGDVALLPEVLKAACEAPEDSLRTLAIRACVRLTTQEETIKLPLKEQIAPLKTILAQPLRPEQKRLVLAGLAVIPDVEALRLAEPMLEDSALQLEAAQATTKIAAALPYGQAEAAKAGLKKVLAATTNVDAQKAAEAALKDIEAGADYIVAWQAAGPYHLAGKEYKDLFDMVFPPETAQAEGVKWQTLPLGPDSKRQWIMDLLKAFGGDQRVAYARTWIHSTQEQPARLELGTDDGVKVWLNHAVVCTNNTFRGIQPGSDKVDVTLKAGWNSLLLKVTQLNQGWAFCVRLLTPDGSHLDGLQFAAEPPKGAAAQ